MKSIWKQYVRQTLLQVNKDQALVPSKAKVLMNTIGTAPGMWIEKNNKVFISLPGVPFEMKALIQNEVIPKLTERFHLPFIIHKTLMVYGLGESTLAARIEAWEDALPEFIKLAYLPDLGRVRLRLSAKGFDKETIQAEVQKQIDAVLPLIKDEFYGFEDEDGRCRIHYCKTTYQVEANRSGCRKLYRRENCRTFYKPSRGIQLF